MKLGYLKDAPLLKARAKTINIADFAGFGSGNMQWYVGQHGKVRSAFDANDLKGAIDAGLALGEEDVGLPSTATVDQVLASPQMLLNFKNKLVSKHFPNNFYKGPPNVEAKIISMLDNAAANPVKPASSQQPAAVAPTMPVSQPISQPTASTDLPPIDYPTYPTDGPSLEPAPDNSMLIIGAVALIGVLALVLIIKKKKAKAAKKAAALLAAVKRRK